MTEVIGKMHGVRRWGACLLLLASGLAGRGQSSPQPSPAPQAAPAAEASPAEDLFLQLGRVGLDKSRVFHIRNASIDRGGFSISLDDGVIGFTEEVAGQVTGAFFEGDGEILLSPPNQVERGSMALQTGGAILEEGFVSAFFRFNDTTFLQLLPVLTPTEHAEEFVQQWNPVVRNLCDQDALRLLLSFSRYLPVGAEPVPPRTSAVPEDEGDQFFRARMEGRTKGAFDVYFDSNVPEQVWAGQLRTVEGTSYYDVWTSFSLPSKNGETSAAYTATDVSRSEGVEVSDYKIRMEVRPPTTIEAEAVLQLQVLRGERRTVVFELARTLVLKEVEADGQPLEFIHNPAMEGTQLARRGNDLVAVIFPQPLRGGQRIQLRFVYGGEVLSEAGPGLLYVGARGTWYPNLGLSMASFELEFHYPAEWTLVATGKRRSAAPASSLSSEVLGAPGEQVSWWASERPIPIAGFNLGKFQRVTAHAGEVTVAAYATKAVERDFPAAAPQVVLPYPSTNPRSPKSPMLIEPPQPSPARYAQTVANTSAHAIESFSRRFGPYPYSELSLTQMPGNLSQGWPGLVFLSSLTFLNEEEKSRLHMDAAQKIILKLVVSHETAHQWWGDLVLWSSYRDQWISEALANYSSLMLFEAEDPPGFRVVMDKYRDDLLEKNKAGQALMEDGAVTLGMRLSCSEFPQGYEAISYGRGTWLMHMLRYMLIDAERKTGGRSVSTDPTDDEPFVRALRRLRERYQGKAITTRQLLQVFEEDLPRSLWFEGRKSLDWFYDGWISGTAVPRYETRSVKYSEKAGEGTTVSGTILQKDAPQDLVTPVPLYASVGGRLTFLGRIFADGPETPFHVTAPAGTRKIVIDPHQTLLARAR